MDIQNSASPSSGGLYRPSRKKGQPTPSRFDMKDAEKMKLSAIRDKVDEEKTTENKRVLEESKQIISSEVNQHLSGSLVQLKRKHQDKIDRKIEEYMGERGPEVKPTPKNDGLTFMDEELKKDIDRIINQQVEQQMQQNGTLVIKKITQIKSTEFKTKKQSDLNIKDDQQQKIDNAKLQKFVKKQVELTKYLMRNSLDERVDAILNKYMSESWHPSSNLDPINHNWLDPNLMDFDSQNAVDNMIKEQIDQQIQPILQSKIQGIVDIRCADFKANAKNYQELRKEELMNTIKQLTMSEFQLHQRSLGKTIEDAVANKLKEKGEYNGYVGVGRISGVKRAGNLLNDKVKQDIDREIDNQLQSLSVQIDSKIKDVAAKQIKDQRDQDLVGKINDMVDYEIKIQKKGLDSKVQLRVNEQIRQYKKNMAPEVEQKIENKFEKKPLPAVKSQAVKPLTIQNFEHSSKKSKYAAPATQRHSYLKRSMIDTSPARKESEGNQYDSVSSPSLASGNLNSRRKRGQRGTATKVAP